MTNVIDVVCTGLLLIHYHYSVDCYSKCYKKCIGDKLLIIVSILLIHPLYLFTIIV